MITRTVFWRAALSALAVATFALVLAGCNEDEATPKKPAVKKADHPKKAEGSEKKSDHPKKAEGSEKKADHPKK